MTKEQFIENWIDKYLETHPDEKVTDFDHLRDLADCEWTDRAIERGEKTEYDLSPEQQREADKARKGIKAVNAYGREVKRERKPNEVKRWLMNIIRILLEGYAIKGDLEAVTLSNAERAIDFVKDGKHYTLTLTEHRPPKGA